MRDRGLLKRLCTLAQQTIAELLRVALNLPQGTPAFLLALHTFGEYLDFHPQIHALVADGLLDAEGHFHVAPEIPTHVLEEPFRARAFKELLAHKLISPELVARMKTWTHSGLNVHIGHAVPAESGLTRNTPQRFRLQKFNPRQPLAPRSSYHH